MKSQFQRQNKYSCRYLAIVLVICFGILSFGGCGKNSSVSDGKEGHFKAAGQAGPYGFCPVRKIENWSLF